MQLYSTNILSTLLASICSVPATRRISEISGALAPVSAKQTGNTGKSVTTKLGHVLHFHLEKLLKRANRPSLFLYGHTEDQ